MSQKQEHIISYGLAIIIAIITIYIYLPTLAPSITWGNGGADGGNLAAAVATLGIPHPPGYPTYVLIGLGWSKLPLNGDLAYRLNLLSTTSIAFAVGLSIIAITFLGRYLALSQIPLIMGSGLGGLFLALSPLIWSQATITEIYSVGLVSFTSLSLGLIVWYYKFESWNTFLTERVFLVVIGIIKGLSFGIVPQIVLATPGMLYLLHAYHKPHKQGLTRFVQRLLLLLCGVGIGLTVFIYLPLRANSQPFVNWGTPNTLPRFWGMVTAASYRQYFTLLSPHEWLIRFVSSLSHLGQELSWTGIIFAILGGYYLWQHDKPILVYLLSLIGLTVIFRTSYPVMGNIVYLIPSLHGLTILTGVGIAVLLTQAKNQIGLAGLLLISLALVGTLVFRANKIAPSVDVSHDYRAVDFAQETFAKLPPDAVIISSQDETTFSLWYYQALGKRLDVVVIDSRLLFYDWYQLNIAVQYPDLNPYSINPQDLLTLKRSIYILDGSLDGITINSATSFLSNSK